MDEIFENAKLIFINNGVGKKISNEEIEQYMLEDK